MIDRRAAVRRVIDTWSPIPFSYGLDCCQFAGAVVEAVAGYNPMRSFSYSNEAEALAAIAEYGDLEAAMRATLGAPYAGPYRDGDVTLQRMQDGQQIAGVLYCGRTIVRTKNSIVDWPLERVDLIWCI